MERADLIHHPAGLSTGVDASEIFKPLPEEPEPEPEPESFHLTDMGNARRLVVLYGELLRYVVEWGWFVWDDTRFRKDAAGQVVRFAKEMVRQIYVEASRATGKSERSAIANHAKRSESRVQIRNTIDLAKSEVEIMVRPEEFDLDLWLLNVKNGTIDLRTGQLREHRREDLITKLAPVSYDPTATAPLWEKFLDRIMGENKRLIRFLQKCSGYSLTGDTREQVIFIFYGTGSNGKTTFLRINGDLLGDYAKWTPATTLLAHRGESIPNDIARLQGARFVVATEIEQNRRLNESLVKAVTGGDIIAARFLHKEFFEFQPQFKVFLGTNHKPEIRGQDHAIWRRIRLIPFTETIPDEEQDRELVEKLKEELPGILNWALEGCCAWLEEGLQEPEEVVQATLDYRTESDILAEWIEEFCVVHPAATASVTDLYQSYRTWCQDSGQKPLSKRWFGRRLAERGFDSGRTARARSWIGIGLKEVRDQ